MLYKGVDIFRCKVFTVDKDSEKLKFYSGKFSGKTADDFNTLTELHAAIGHCFWIMNKKDEPVFPLCSKYAASAFIKELTPKLVLLEEKLRELSISEQEKLAKETEESAKQTGTKYI